MKLVTYRVAGAAAPYVGVLLSDGHAVARVTGFSSMLELIDGGAQALAHVRSAVAAAPEIHARRDVTLLSPLPEPRQLRDAMCFEQHYRQGLRAMAAMRMGKLLGWVAVELGLARIPSVWYQQPTYYKCNRFSVVGDQTDVIWPAGAELLDYECEIAIIIGKTGKDIPRERAHEFIFGYTIFNDITARDLQEREMRALLGPAKGKDFDTGNVLGPCIVTPDEIGDPHALGVEVRVDGVVWSVGSTRGMHHRWEDVIAHISKNETLHAGEVIASGTIANGCGLELGRFLWPGACVELSVDRIGTLTNRLVKL